MPFVSQPYLKTIHHHHHQISNNTKSWGKKYKDTEIEISPVYFNSTAKTVIKHKFDLDESFQKFCTAFITGLMKDLVRLLNQSGLNILLFWLIDH